MSDPIDFTRFEKWDAPALPTLSPLKGAKERILARWPNIVADPEAKDREALAQAVRHRLETWTWDQTKLSLVTSAARAIFDHERRERDDLRSVRQFYYDEIKASTRPSFLDAMFEVYRETFEPGSFHTRALAETLEIARSRLGSRSQDLLGQLPSLLDPDKAATEIASRMLEMENTFKGLQDLGLRSPHAPGVMDHAHLEYVRFLSPRLKTRAGLERLFSWVKPDGHRVRTSGAAETITAVLEKWKDSRPSETDIRYLTDMLVSLYGDPRLKSSSGGHWPLIRESLRDLFLQWLSGEDIRFFMEVLEAVDITDTKMFSDRRELWTSLYEQGEIVQTWVALSDRAMEYARKSLNRINTIREPRYGRQTKGDANAPSLLIMKTRNGRTVVEGSHNHCVYVFKDSENPPKLFEAYYQALSRRDYPSHVWKVHRGDWQGWVFEQLTRR